MPGRGKNKGVPTERDVAELAGVSQSAVSRAFTPGASVAETTRERILAAAQELGYHPNLIARSLSTNRSNIVGLAISSLENPFYAQMVKELSERLEETGRHVLLVTTSPGEVGDAAVEAFLSYRIDALILTATSPTKELVQRFRRSGVPIVLINRETDLAGVSTVRGENRRAGEVIAAFLLAGGHKRFAFIGGSEASTVGRTRQAAFATYLTAHGHAPPLVRHGDYTFAGGAAAARSLLSLSPRPDAIFCASDYMAFAALDVARREFSLSMPGDLSVVGFDDVAEARHSAYDLTTFSQPPAAMAREAVAILDAHLAGRTRTERREVHGNLVVRATARVPERGIVAVEGRRVWRPES